jgi:hypothetical protein
MVCNPRLPGPALALLWSRLLQEKSENDQPVVEVSIVVDVIEGLH